jgi:hypothetical protein
LGAAVFAAAGLAALGSSAGSKFVGVDLAIEFSKRGCCVFTLSGELMSQLREI